MKIRQLSVNYVAEQDRILLRVNTAASEEIRLWLTRRMMVGLWPLLSKLGMEHLLKFEAAGASLDAADEGLKRMLADFRKEQVLREADFKTPYDEGVALLPLGEEPLLVTDLHATPLQDGRLRLRFDERAGKDASPRTFEMTIDPTLLQGLVHLLDQALAVSQWREAFGAGSASGAAAPDADASGTGTPRYLN